MAKMKAKDFAAQAEVAYEEKWGYIWGQSGAVWTKAKQDALEKKYNSNPTKYTDYKLAAEIGAKWIGRKVSDCSGLPYGILERFGVKTYHGSNSIWKNNLSHKGKITPGMKLPVGAAIFTGTESDHPHMGILTTETCVTEAHGTVKGVIHTPISNKKWTYWGLYKAVEYDFIPGETTIPDSVTLPVVNEVVFPTLRRGAKGDSVKMMQNYLIAKGENLPKYGADGDFGAETLKALKSFQKAQGLTVDGICGPKTWAALVAS